MDASPKEVLGFDLDAAIVALIQRNELQIPPYPAVAMKIAELTRTGDFGLDDVARVITADQVLTATVLRFANSAFYAGQTAATTALQALQRVGVKSLVNVALAGALKTEATRTGPLFALRRNAWQRGVASAFVCETLARFHHQRPEEAFLCGLLHDFGELVAISCIEQLLRSHPEGQLPEAQWQEIIHRYHVELGLITAARWQLPELVVESITGQQLEDPSTSEHPEMVALVKLSDVIVPLLLSSSRLVQEDLEKIPGLGKDGAQALLQRIPELPPLLASFADEDATLKHPEASRVETPSVGPVGPPTSRPVDFPVKARVSAHATQAYQATEISVTGLRLCGAPALKQSHALELSLEPQDAPALVLWVQVRTCVAKDGGGFEMVVTPFALDKERGKKWRELAMGQAAR